MGNCNAEDVLKRLVNLLLEHLDDLKNVMDVPERQFEYGEKTAYVEIAEVLQLWEKAEKCGLDFRIEDKYPLL